MSLELTILGSNAAAFAHRRHHTAQVLKIADKYALIDCGEGTQLLMKRYNIKHSKIRYIFISHLHGDHYFGLIGLLSTMHLFGRKQDLTLVGPPGLREIIRVQLRYSETSLHFKIDFREFVPGEKYLILEDSKFTVHALPMNHRIPCAGYFFQEKPKKRRIKREVIDELQLTNLDIIRLKEGDDLVNDQNEITYSNAMLTYAPLPSCRYAFFSDTRLQPELVADIAQADLLYHEATFTSQMLDRARQTYHTTAEQAAQFARDAQVGKLLLGHFSARYKELDVILEEARHVFENTELAIEGQKFIVDGK